ncbi:bone morphogenetic protein 7-like [Cololabis saira]|uniref:bone morphogenetic protein 7-like n=1 Tax=Cololabis saira TaxID=129043 RepID=UPI002AD3F891|nr:bone morphogenetic protein 7-like [Cololabis saira]
MWASAVATVALLLTWGQGAAATRLTFYNSSSAEDELRSSFIQRRLRGQERREIQREILSVLGLPARPRPHLRTKHNAAPTFMLDLYNTVSMETNPPGYSYYQPVLPTRASGASPQDSRLLEEADTVMSFLNLIDQDLQHHTQEFRFDMSRIPEGEAITAAEFRLYKGFTHEGTENQTFRVSVYQLLQESRSSEVELLLLDQRDVWASQEGWLVFHLTAASTLWPGSPEQTVSLHVVLQDSSGRRSRASAAGLLTGSGPKDKQPFLVVFFKAGGVRFRSVRSAHGHKGRQSNRSRAQKAVQEAMKVAETAAVSDNVVFSKEGCKKRELYVSFRDLGWQDWIIAPEGYAAYYCEGECAFPLNSYMNATNHAIVQTLVHFINPETVPKPCCAPTQLHGISVLYFDDSSNVILKKYPNMVVRACGCH